MTIQKPRRILLSPLDWGMGHTTRCVPIIRYLQRLGHEVTVAGNDWQRGYLQATFPGIEALPLTGYNVHYKGKTFMTAVGRQVPGIVQAINYERRWLNDLLQQRHFDGVVSDNRYGLHHPKIHSIFITHQVGMRTGLGPLVDGIVQLVHYRYINRFTDCWLVDVAGKLNLSGALSHPRILPKQTKFIGLLSQLHTTPNSTGASGPLTILLSGPEPQRTILSDILRTQAQQYKGAVVFIEGSHTTARTSIPAHIQYHQRITASELQPLLQQAGMVVCRSGYSTLMDLIALGKKAIVIPTPGQAEQEYLGKHLHQQGIFLCRAQNSFSLSEALRSAKEFSFNNLPLQDRFEDHHQVIDNWLQTL